MTLSELYSELKQSDSRGIEINDSELYHSAINQGFAQKGILETFGTYQSIMLSAEGRKYDSYQHYKDRHKPTNSINIGGSVTGSQIVQSSDFDDFKNKPIVDSKAQANTLNSNQKSKLDIKTVVQYLAWIAGISSAILAVWKYFTKT